MQIPHFPTLTRAAAFGIPSTSVSLLCSFLEWTDTVGGGPNQQHQHGHEDGQEKRGWRTEYNRIVGRAKDGKMDFFRFAQLLLVGVIHRVGHGLVAHRKVDFEYRLGHSARR